MKFLFSALILTMFSTVSFACDEQYAQVVAKVVGVESNSLTTCKAMVSEESISYFGDHVVCGLSKSEIISNGIDFPLVNGHDCEVPDTIAGVLVKSGSKITVE